MNPDVVLITGCSTGIGRATATMLVAAGYEVVTTARTISPAWSTTTIAD